MSKEQWPRYEDLCDEPFDSQGTTNLKQLLIYHIQWVLQLSKYKELAKRKGFWKYYRSEVNDLAEMLWTFDENLPPPPHLPIKHNRRDYISYFVDLLSWCESPCIEINNKPKSPARHSQDFRYVHWYGVDYRFTDYQAKCIEVLWERWENGTPEVGRRTILKDAGCDSKRLVDVFKDHKTWKRLVARRTTKGPYRLKTPKS